MTRRQARAWLAPMRACFRKILETGEADYLDGHAVTLCHDGRIARIDECCAGFRGLIERLFPEISTRPLLLIEEWLAEDKPIRYSQVESAMAMFMKVENALIKQTAAKVRSAVLDEEIQIEIDCLGMSEP